MGLAVIPAQAHYCPEKISSFDGEGLSLDSVISTKGRNLAFGMGEKRIDQPWAVVKISPFGRNDSLSDR
ncbi:MAG TPA: hypothetical protein VK000_02240 [Luteimonas sp.]|nr:hypothetical protein [Luteimonas sp.]